MDGMRFTILTGAPGSGKTTTLDDLDPGIRTVGEPAREILAEQRAASGMGSLDHEPELFVELLLRRSIHKHRAAETTKGPVVFDRGVPDCVAYAVALGVDPAPSVAASRRYRYQQEVLVLPPWEEIYTTDDERRMSFADTIPFHEAVVEAYERAGYTLIEVPRGSAAERAAFVRRVVTGR